MKERKGSFDFISNCLIVAGAVISYFPLYWLLSSSFKYSHAINNMVPEWFPKHPTLQNYVNLFSNSNTLRWLFNSVFIGIPACIGYMMQCDVNSILPVMGAALVFHGIGVVYGSRNAVRINQNLLKKGIAVFSILIAIWKLL